MLFSPLLLLLRQITECNFLCVAGGKQTEYNVCFLPPLVLNFELPADYPSTSSPVFTLSSKWMTGAQVRLMLVYIILA